MAPDLHTERLRLTPLNTTFCTQQYVNWMNDPGVYKYLETGGDYTLQKLKEYLLNVELNEILFWAIMLKDSDKHIGNIKIDPINSKHGLGEYGIMMGDKNEWNKGYAKEASASVIQFCFQKLGLRKITLGVIEANIPSVNLYYKLGFEVEGVYKNHVIHDDKYCNALRMAIFNKEFQY